MITERGSVYFVKQKGLSPIKIGYSGKEDPRGRIASMATASPYGMQIIGIIITDSPAKLEAKLHSKYADRRLTGEWFDISLQDVDFEIKENSEEYELERRNEMNIHYLNHFRCNGEEEGELDGIQTVPIVKLISNFMKKKGYYIENPDWLHSYFIPDSYLRNEACTDIGVIVSKKEFRSILIKAGYKSSFIGSVRGWTVYKNI